MPQSTMKPFVGLGPKLVGTLLLAAVLVLALGAPADARRPPTKQSSQQQQKQQEVSSGWPHEDSQPLELAASRGRAKASRANSNDDDDDGPTITEATAVDPEFAALTSEASDESLSADEAAAGAADEEAAPAPSQILNSRPQKRASPSMRKMSGAPPPSYRLYEPNGEDSNIANAKVTLKRSDMAFAAGHHHHHHHGHSPSGWLEMGAHTGKKGAFGWHDKHPVGGKGR